MPWWRIKRNERPKERAYHVVFAYLYSHGERSLPGSCQYCHAAHSGIGGATPLWNQKLSTQVYTAYQSSTDPSLGNTQPAAGSDSTLCLSCHDGTIAPGQTAVYGKVPMSSAMKSGDLLGTNLLGDHPTSLVLPIKDAPDLAASIVSQGKTIDPTGAVQLIKGNIECTSCHNPHVQSIDKTSQNVLVRDSSSGQMCLACHDPRGDAVRGRGRELSHGRAECL
jgi:predicted CXXCH cytochrome family protein